MNSFFDIPGMMDPLDDSLRMTIGDQNGPPPLPPLDKFSSNGLTQAAIDHNGPAPIDTLDGKAMELDEVNLDLPEPENAAEPLCAPRKIRRLSTFLVEEANNSYSRNVVLVDKKKGASFLAK
jgi:hypothetical protein